MKCHEILLTHEEAGQVYEQLVAEDLFDMLPTLVTIPADELNGSPELSVAVDDTAARVFINQFERSLRIPLSLQLYLPCVSNSLDHKLGQIEKDPYLRGFFNILMEVSGSSSLDEYLLSNALTSGDINSLIDIARIVQDLSPTKGLLAEKELRPFMQSLRYIIAQKDIKSVASALKNMRREVKHDFYMGNKRVTDQRPLNIRDMTCQVLSIAALNDYELALRMNFSLEERSRLPVGLTVLPFLKGVLVNGKVVSIHQTSAVTRGELIRYDEEYNTINYSDAVDPEQFFGSASQDVVHHLQHALRDWEGPNFARDLYEAEAYMVETFYAVLNLGAAKVKVAHYEVFDQNDGENAEALKLLQERLGLDGQTLFDIFPKQSMNYRYMAAEFVGWILSKVKSGGIVDKNEYNKKVGKIAKAYVLYQSVTSLIELVAGKGELADLRRQLKAGGFTYNTELIEVEGERIRSRNATLPKDLKYFRFGDDASLAQRAVTGLFLSDRDNGFRYWEKIRNQMILYVACMPLEKDFTPERLKRYLQESLIPFMQLEYTSVHGKVEHMGVE